MKKILIIPIMLVSIFLLTACNPMLMGDQVITEVLYNTYLPNYADRYKNYLEILEASKEAGEEELFKETYYEEYYSNVKSYFSQKEFAEFCKSGIFEKIDEGFINLDGTIDVSDLTISLDDVEKLSKTYSFNMNIVYIDSSEKEIGRVNQTGTAVIIGENNREVIDEIIFDNLDEIDQYMVK